MNKFVAISIASLVALGLASFTAHAQKIDAHPSTVLEARLTRFNLDRGHGQANQRGLQGSVSVSPGSKNVSLNVYLMPVCKPMQACPKFIVGVITSNVQIRKTFTDACGARHYVASYDARMADGELEQIEIVDNARNFCERFPAPAPTVVKYTTDGRRGRLTSTFEGMTLLPPAIGPLN